MTGKNKNQIAIKEFKSNKKFRIYVLSFSAGFGISKITRNDLSRLLENFYS